MEEWGRAASRTSTAFSYGHVARGGGRGRPVEDGGEYVPRRPRRTARFLGTARHQWGSGGNRIPRGANEAARGEAGVARGAIASARRAIVSARWAIVSAPGAIESARPAKVPAARVVVRARAATVSPPGAISTSPHTRASTSPGISIPPPANGIPRAPKRIPGREDWILCRVKRPSCQAGSIRPRASSIPPPVNDFPRRGSRFPARVNRSPPRIVRPVADADGVLAAAPSPGARMAPDAPCFAPPRVCYDCPSPRD